MKLSGDVANDKLFQIKEKNIYVIMAKILSHRPLKSVIYSQKSPFGTKSLFIHPIVNGFSPNFLEMLQMRRSFKTNEKYMCHHMSYVINPAIPQ